MSIYLVPIGFLAGFVYCLAEKGVRSTLTKSIIPFPYYTTMRLRTSPKPKTLAEAAEYSAILRPGHMKPVEAHTPKQLSDEEIKKRKLEELKLQIIAQNPTGIFLAMPVADVVSKGIAKKDPVIEEAAKKNFVVEEEEEEEEDDDEYWDDDDEEEEEDYEYDDQYWDDDDEEEEEDYEYDGDDCDDEYDDDDDC